MIDVDEALCGPEAVMSGRLRWTNRADTGLFTGLSTCTDGRMDNAVIADGKSDRIAEHYSTGFQALSVRVFPTLWRTLRFMLSFEPVENDPAVKEVALGRKAGPRTLWMGAEAIAQSVQVRTAPLLSHDVRQVGGEGKTRGFHPVLVSVYSQ